MEVGAVTRPIVRANRYFFSKREGNQNQPVVYWREGYKGESKVLIDPARLDRVGSDHGRVVFAVAGRQAARLRHVSRRRREHDAASARGRRSADARPRDSRQDPGARLAARRLGIRLSEPEEPQGSVHRPGALSPDAAPIDARTALLFRQYTKPRKTPSWRRPGDRSAACRATAAGSCSATGSTRSRTTCGWSTSIAFSPTGRIDKTVVTVGADGQAVGTVIDGTLFIHTTKGAPRGRIVAARASQPDRRTGGTSCRSAPTRSSRRCRSARA